MNQAEYRTSKRNDSDLRKEIMNATALQIQRPKTSSYIQRQYPPFTASYQKQNEQSPFSSERNVKFKLEQLQQRLSEVLDKIRLDRELLKETILYASELKGSLIYQDLYGAKQDLDGRMQGLSSQIRQRRQNDEQRYRQIRKECNVIWERTEETREKVFQLQLRVERVEEKLGYKDIYRLEYY